MKIYCVGGAVRDELLGLPVRDRDWVVVGATPERVEHRRRVVRERQHDHRQRVPPFLLAESVEELEALDVPREEDDVRDRLPQAVERLGDARRLEQEVAGLPHRRGHDPPLGLGSAEQQDGVLPVRERGCAPLSVRASAEGRRLRHDRMYRCEEPDL